MPTDGTFAEYVIIDIDRLHLKPPHLSLIEAATFPLAGTTAYRALFVKGQFNSQKRVLVTGIGSGVSQFVALFGVHAGGEVWVTSSKDEKIQLAIDRIGVKGGFNNSVQGWSKNVAKKVGGKFDVVVDGTGGHNFGFLIELLKSGGKLVTYGATSGIPKTFPIHNVFLSQKEILGTTMGSDRDFLDMINFINGRQISFSGLIDKVFPLEDLHLALERMREGKQFGKLILAIQPKASL
eukprot:TRINITY_DN2131_c0_g2_i5.p1 TRINITY_DN2131_c0_g2~~TRINITY_DN2131_c0_g2_i5.p1  ORF type:complete len:237 (+),score=45.93 TRINITY_DN2131_c0_g2_i5:377-1087(+)